MRHFLEDLAKDLNGQTRDQNSFYHLQKAGVSTRALICPSVWAWIDMKGETQRLMDFTEAHRWPSSEISPPVSRKDSKDRKHCIGHDGQGQLKHAHCVTNLWEMEGSLIVIDLRWTGWKEKRPVEWYLKLTWAVATFNRSPVMEIKAQPCF